MVASDAGKFEISRANSGQCFDGVGHRGAAAGDTLNADAKIIFQRANQFAVDV